ncbi:MAG: DUF5343 domain-containing protein [Chitinophagaceae bacterium]|nr:MAG: DUF5343 domain-containing protein [Chitinophagaceae bacterium]
MGLPTTYSQEFKKFKDFFAKIRDAQAPPKFTNQLLLDWGYKSKNHRAFIPLLKSLGFLTWDGALQNDIRNFETTLHQSKLWVKL